MVVVDEANTGALGLDDVAFGRGAHFVGPVGQSRLLADVFKDNGAGLYETARGDGPMLRIKER